MKQSAKTGGNILNIIVCIKQVPGSNKVEVDPVTGVLKRDGKDTKMNPYDLYAMETAIQLKETFGGMVKVITMGPPAAEAVLYEAFSMGADEGYLMTDRAFAGADVLATSYTLSQGIRLMGDYDLILCGKQTTDGDTAQVGSEISENLGLPSIANVKKISDVDPSGMAVTMDMQTALERSRVSFPCLISVDKDIFLPRLPSYRLMEATKDREIKKITLADLPDRDPKRYGLNGSPTQVQRIFPPAVNSERETLRGSAEDLAGQIVTRLRRAKLL